MLDAISREECSQRHEDLKAVIAAHFDAVEKQIEKICNNDIEHLKQDIAKMDEKFTKLADQFNTWRWYMLILQIVIALLAGVNLAERFLGIGV